MNHPMGPLQLGESISVQLGPSYPHLYLVSPFRSSSLHPSLPPADFIGLDPCLAIQQTLYSGTADSKYRPSVLLERMVDAGWVGKKCGKGFYEY